MAGFLSSIWKRQPEKFDSDGSFIMVPETSSTTQDGMPSVFHMPKCGHHNLYEITVDELQHLFSSRSLTSAEYIKFCLARIQQVGLGLCAITTTRKKIG